MNKMVKQLLLAGACIILIYGICFAGNPYRDGKGYSKNKGMIGKSFSDIDANNDGSMTFEEYKKAFPSAEKKGFEFLDENKDSKLDAQEWQIFKDMHKGMGASKGKYHDSKLPDPSGFNAHFGDMDKDGDTLVTRGEFNAYFSDKNQTDKVFDAVDSDKSGTLDHDEWHEFKEAHGLGHIK